MILLVELMNDASLHQDIANKNPLMPVEKVLVDALGQVSFGYKSYEKIDHLHMAMLLSKGVYKGAIADMVISPAAPRTNILASWNFNDF